VNDLAEPEIPLTGGRTRTGVVRVGDTVRRPLVPQSPFVHELLGHLESKGFAGAPRFLGVDASGREILSFLHGEVPPNVGYLPDKVIAAGAHLLRALHEATVDSPLRGSDEVVCHGDPSPCNCVFVNGAPKAFIDFDLAHAGSRRDDVANAAWLWLNLGNERMKLERQAWRLRGFYANYGKKARVEDAIPAILEAQERLAARLSDRPEDRQWVEKHLRWVETNRKELLDCIAAVGSGS
jgi:Ser/Thr protein kinase RdoA (MazF antagonist)